MKKKIHSDLVSETRLDSTRLDSTSVLGKSPPVSVTHHCSINLLMLSLVVIGSCVTNDIVIYKHLLNGKVILVCILEFLKVLDRAVCCLLFCSIFVSMIFFLQLQADSCGVSLRNLKFNSFAYADDVTVFCASATGLQKQEDQVYDCG